VRPFRIVLLALSVTGLGISATFAADSRSGAAFRVIVHPSNPVTSVDQRFLVDAFLKKITRWSHDEPIRPVDLHPDSAVRRRFSDDGLKRSVSAVKIYWQQMVFSGRGVPPPELDNDEQVVRYVLRNPGAIGYVSGAANVEGVKVLLVR
jgi:ABC-type phosphate transport system substrate-binding protein